MGNHLNLESLRSFARKGHAAQMAVDLLLQSAKGCPYCGKTFLPQTKNQIYCDYKCRTQSYAELRHMKRHHKKGEL